ncbi:MAG: glycosyltransferase [Clostridium sp. Maddingley MBC34-26]|nr:MAG: glycosyltransferase [Clostridium sp. Maddingley MBC34-26]
MVKICYLADINSVHTHKWINFFKKQSYDIHVISLSDGEYEGVTVHSLDIDESLVKQKSDTGKFGYLKKITRVKELVNKIKPDILHAHYATSYGLLGAMTNYHPYIISVWGADVYDFPIKSFLHKWIVKYNLKKADYIWSTSRVMKKETEKYTNKEIMVTPFGVDIKKFIPKVDNKEGKDEIVIGTIKTLEEKYGVEYLIKAFAKVKSNNENLNVKLRIGGKGSQEEYLKNLCIELGIEDDVMFLGFLSEAQVITEFQNFDIAVFPSTLDSESFGVAAVEAEACGIPVIVSDVGGLMESTKPNVTSLVAKRKSVDSLFTEIQKLVVNNELRMKMGVSARKFVEENYSLVNNFNDIDSIYRDILKK